MDRVRVALIGCGFYAQNHLQAWKDLAARGADLVAVCDRDPAKAKAAGERFGAPFFTDAAEMFDAVKIDLVDITTRMDTHRELAALAADRGVGAVVQKPFAPDWETARPSSRTPGRVARGSRCTRISASRHRCAGCATSSRQEPSASRTGRASPSAPASTSTGRSPISTRRRVSPSSTSASTSSISRASSWVKSSVSPARPSAAIRR